MCVCLCGCVGVYVCVCGSLFGMSVCMCVFVCCVHLRMCNCARAQLCRWCVIGAKCQSDYLCVCVCLCVCMCM